MWPWYHFFVILPLPPIQKGQLSVRRKYVHKYWLTDLRTNPAQEKCELDNWPARHDRESADWTVKLQIKQTKF